MVRNNQVLSTEHTDTQFTKTNQNITLDYETNVMKIVNDLSKNYNQVFFPYTVTPKLARDHKEDPA